MMRVTKTILLGLLVVALCGCDGGQIGTTVLTGQDTDMVARVGLEKDGISGGIVAKWTPSSEMEWGPEPDQIGAFVILEATWDVQATDTPDVAPAPITWLEELHMIPYVGLELIDDCDNDNFGNLQPNWIVGAKYMVNPDGNMAIVTEYVVSDLVPDDVYVGLQYRF